MEIISGIWTSDKCPVIRWDRQIITNTAVATTTTPVADGGLLRGIGANPIMSIIITTMMTVFGWTTNESPLNHRLPSVRQSPLSWFCVSGSLSLLPTVALLQLSRELFASFVSARAEQQRILNTDKKRQFRSARRAQPRILSIAVTVDDKGGDF